MIDRLARDSFSPPGEEATKARRAFSSGDARAGADQPVALQWGHETCSGSGPFRRGAVGVSRWTWVRCRGHEFKSTTRALGPHNQLLLSSDRRASFDDA